MAEMEDKSAQIHCHCPIDPKVCGANQAKIEQVLSAVHELSGRIDKMHELHRIERKDFWEAINGIKESITGTDGKKGLSHAVDRNTCFRQNLSKWLWALFAPLYIGLITLIVNLIFETFKRASGG